MEWTIETRELEVSVGSRRLAVRPLALGFQRRLKERGVVMPIAPRAVARDSSGRVMRDEHGEPVLQRNEADGPFQAAVERYHERVAVLMVAESIGAELGFETSAPADGHEWNRYADALADEMRLAGWTADDLVRVCEGICEASRVTCETVAEAGACFFSDEAEGRSSPVSTSRDRGSTTCCERASVCE